MSGSTKRSILAVATLCFVFGQAGRVQAGSTAYVVAHDFSGSGRPDLFGTVDMTTGDFTLISDLSTPGFTIFGMGFGAGGQIYGVGFKFVGLTSPGELFGINPTTGATTDLGPLTYPPASAASNGSGPLYAIDVTTTSTSSLFSINPPSNTSSLIGTVPFTSDGLLAIDSQGNLFAAGNSNGSFYEVNTTNASTTLIGNTGLGSSLFGGTFVGNTLYGFSVGSTYDTIVTIDTANAGVTTGANVALPANYDIVAATGFAVPEPTSVALALIGLLSVFGFGLLRDGG